MIRQEKKLSQLLNYVNRLGIRVMMITGDHKKTAQAIADQIGLKTSGVLTGNET